MSHSTLSSSSIRLSLPRCANKKFNKPPTNHKREYSLCLCLLVSFNPVEDEDVGVAYFELFDLDLTESLFAFLFFYHDVEFNRMVPSFSEKTIF